MENNQKNHSKPLILIAQVISWVCHPIFMPALMAIVLHKLTPVSFSGVTDHNFTLWLVSIGMTTIFFPLFSIGLLKPLGFLKSLHMPDAKDRIVPLMMTMIFYFWISHVFNSMSGVTVPLIIRVLFLGNFWGIILIFLINIFTKISMHTAAAGGMIGNIIVLMILSPVNMEVPLFLALLVGGIIGTARMLTGAHQRGDVWLGYIVGIIVQLAAWVYLH
jgi:hypothetical protein